jgi:hypothetical protein
VDGIIRLRSVRGSEGDRKYFVPILYGERDFDAFDEFCDFVESVSYGVSKTCKVRGSNPCRGATYSGAESFSSLFHSKPL